MKMPFQRQLSLAGVTLAISGAAMFAVAPPASASGCAEGDCVYADEIPGACAPMDGGCGCYWQVGGDNPVDDPACYQ